VLSAGRLRLVLQEYGLHPAERRRLALPTRTIFRYNFAKVWVEGSNPFARSMVDHAFAFAEARAAYDHLAAGRAFGKVVFRIA